MTAEDKTLFRGKIIELRVERVHLPGGPAFDLEVVRHPGGAAVVAVNSEGHVCLLRQYRHVVDTWLWELPAGKRDGEEPPLLTARRELAEEAGLEAGSWQELGEVVSSPGVFTEKVYLFLARNLHLVDAAPEADERFEVHWVPMTMAREWADRGTIVDAKTLVGLYRAEALLRPHDHPLP